MPEDEPAQERSSSAADRLGVYAAEMRIRAAMSSEDAELDVEREFITSRAEYLGPDSEWEAKLVRWERRHPNWPISRNTGATHG